MPITDADLLALLRATPQQPAKPAALPELSPEIILSPAAQQEILAARGTFSRPRSVSPEGADGALDYLQALMAEPAPVADDPEELAIPRREPNPRVRFTVGRDTPPRMPLDRASFHGPSEGQVVGRRGPDGRFAVEARPREREAPTQQRPAGVARVQPQQEPKAPAVRGPSVYESVLGPSPFDD